MINLLENKLEVTKLLVRERRVGARLMTRLELSEMFTVTVYLNNLDAKSKYLDPRKLFPEEVEYEI